MGYGHHVSSLEVFLDSMGSVTSPKAVRRHISGYMTGGFTYQSPYMFAPGQPSPGRPTLLRHPIAIRSSHVSSSLRRAAPNRYLGGFGAYMVVQEYQPVVHRLRLSASPSHPTNPGRMSLPQEPLGIRRRGSSPLVRYSYLHSHSTTLHRRFPDCFSAEIDAPLPIHHSRRNDV